MRSEEEKRCPLCAEQMDWTDQQFMPCKCGYQICVWCWNHIVDIAVKDEMEGRCPACRSIYEMDRILAMQANLERTFTKTTNKKAKQSKSKTKADEGKKEKDLSNVRVIQRKMAYVMGLPLSLADEDVLVRKDYFGQYGKVNKICLSRTAGGAIQRFINDTCSVYITYSKGEEALRCIQSVHGFVLNGRPLRASFGTAKYCHAWLKNNPCNNPACLYLHNIGADEDTFGKDEVAAVHTRIRVQQIVGFANNAIERSGNMLPPPEEDICNNISDFTEKPSPRNVISEAAHGSVNSSDDTKGTFPSSEEKEGCVTVPHRLTTSVNILGRSSTSGKDGNCYEDKRISDLSSEPSSINISGDKPPVDPYSYPSSCKDSSSNSIRNFLDKSPRDVSLSDDQGSDHASGLNRRPLFPYPNYPFTTSESSALLHEKNHVKDDLSMDGNSVHNHENEAPLPLRCTHSVLNTSFQEMQFQNSAEHDRIYRNSRSFSNEEIVAHLRRIDDGALTSAEDQSALDVVEQSIISNILSLDFDSWDDAFEKLNVFSDGVSGKSLNCDLVGYPFAKPEGCANQISGSILPDCGGKDQHMCKAQYPASGAQRLISTGFTLPVRFPPPGFSQCDRTTPSSLPSSGYQSNTMLQQSARKDPKFTQIPAQQTSSVVQSIRSHWIGNGVSKVNYDASSFKQMPQQRSTNGLFCNADNDVKRQREHERFGGVSKYLPSA